MAIINTYDKNSDLRCYGCNIFEATESVLKSFPREYGNCYYRNLETLKLYELDQLSEVSYAGYYDADLNIVEFKKVIALGHELFHMASNDLTTGRFGVLSDDEKDGIGLTEGMTEYFNAKAYNLEIPSAFHLEVFCVTMLENVPNIFRTYFIPSHDDFLALFPDKDNAHHFLKSVDLYTDMYMTYLHNYHSGAESTYEYLNFKGAITDVLNSLVTMELSIENDPRKLELYARKFLKLFSGDRLPDIFPTVYPEYQSFANELVDKRIRKK